MHAILDWSEIGALLGTIAIIVSLTQPVISILGKGFSWRDFILIAGGLFLLSADSGVQPGMKVS